MISRVLIINFQVRVRVRDWSDLSRSYKEVDMFELCDEIVCYIQVNVCLIYAYLINRNMSLLNLHERLDHDLCALGDR